MISWLKLDVNILDDAKVKIIRSHPDGDKVFVLWVGLLCLAMKSPRPGIIEISDGLPYSPDDISHLFDIEIKTVEMGLSLFKKYKMIDIDNKSITIISIENWAKIDRSCMDQESGWQRLRLSVFERDNFTCVYCGDKNGPFEADHVFPKSRGGEDSEINLACACRSCNQSKRDRTPEEWRSRNGANSKH